MRFQRREPLSRQSVAINRWGRYGPALLASIIAASLLSGAGSAAPTSGAPGSCAALVLVSALSCFPDAPEKALVPQYCEVCHDLNWIVRSGGTKEGWEDRLVRMIRAGATIPRNQIPALAAYLAKAFPPRARPQEAP